MNDTGKTLQHPWLLSLLLAIVIVLLWRLLVAVEHYPSFILPTPEAVAAKAIKVIADGSLWGHARITLLEVGIGLLLGVTAGIVSGYFLAKWRLLESVLSPYIVAAQSIPVVALAPLLVIWFGFGLLSKILICALIVYFPMLVNTIIGIRSVPPDLADLMRVLRASPWQIFVKLEAPAALPMLFGGLRLSVTLAVVGAVVGEFVGADRGLGFLVNLAKGLFDTPLMFVALGTLMLIAMTLYLAVLTLERKMLAWRYVR